MSIKILVTDGSNKNSLAVLRSLGKQHYSVDVTTSLPKILTLCRHSKFCTKVHIIKSDINDIDSYATELLSILNDEKYDAFIPVGLKSYFAVSKYKEEFNKLTRTVVPDFESMKIAFNKDQSAVLAKNLGIPVPETVVLCELSDLPQIKTFPMVIKSSDNSGGFIKYCNNVDELFQNFTDLKSKSKTAIIAQEYIHGFGCGFYGVYDSGKLIAHFLHRRIKELPITGGESVIAESYFDDKLFHYGKQICDELKWNGPIMVEFKYDTKREDYYLIEINPKLWGSLDLTIEAGVDVPIILIKIAFKENILISNYKYIKYKWIFPGELKVLASDFNFKNLIEFLNFGSGINTNFYVEDPLPFFIQAIRAFLELPFVIFSYKKKFPHGKVGLSKK